MDRRKYAFRRGLKWRLLENIAMMAAFLIIIIAMGVLGLDVWTTVVLAICVGLGVAYTAWNRVRVLRNLAERVVVDDVAIEAKPFLGRAIRLAWDEISLRREYVRRDPFRGPFPQVWLIGRDPDSRIVLDGEMPGADDLLREVRSRTPNARSGGDRRWWERVLFPLSADDT